MCDLHDMAEEHKKVKHERRNAQGFARAVTRWANGDRMQFRVDPTTATYGSNHPWHDMGEPKFMPNFQYRALPKDS